MLPFDHIRRAAVRFADRPALIDGAQSITHRDLLGRVDALAAAYQKIDPTPQSRVGICADNIAEHLIAFLATLASGKTWVPLNPRNGKDELNRIAAATAPSILVLGAAHADKLDARPGTTRIISGADPSPSETNLRGLIEAHLGEKPADLPLAPDDIQAIKFTGGSSGRPKGCLQTYRVWNTCITSMLLEFGFDADDRNLLAAPMTHGTGTLLVPILASGGSHVVLGGPAKPAAVLDAFERAAITTVFLPPTVIYMMMAEPGVTERRFPALRHLIVGGAAMRPEAVAEAMTLFNGALETCFGQTEAPQIATCMRAADWSKPENLASCGRATALTEVAALGQDGSRLPPGAQGEIALKGDLVMKGYLDMPDETAATIRDGWLMTGDIGLVDDRGFVFIKDRARDVIITGGFNVYPSDVEAVLGRHPAVRECVVFGRPDDKWGEAVEAAVEIGAGTRADEAEIIAHVKQHLDSVKAPKRVHIVDQLPRSPVGKVLRREAKARLTGL